MTDQPRALITVLLGVTALAVAVFFAFVQFEYEVRQAAPRAVQPASVPTPHPAPPNFMWRSPHGREHMPAVGGETA